MSMAVIVLVPVVMAMAVIMSTGMTVRMSFRMIGFEGAVLKRLRQLLARHGRPPSTERRRRRMGLRWVFYVRLIRPG